MNGKFTPLNTDMPFFSICIPAYKNIHYLKRLLDTVFDQTFTDYEVIITDDSPDENLKVFFMQHYKSKAIRYYKNPVAMGTPDNWNEAINKATGDWIKLMHDDDWFCTNNALQILFNSVQQNEGLFYFSAYNNVYLDEANKIEPVHCPIARWKRVLEFPPNLYARNIIGPPSVTIVKREINEVYDNRMKWLVDIDYYIRLMNIAKPVYIDTPLVNVGIGNSQVTAYTHNKPDVEIPEGLLLLSKLSELAFNHILFYDAWWRLIRNVNIRSVEQLRSYTGVYSIPTALYRIIKMQKTLPINILRTGVFSKAYMALSWLQNKISDRHTY